MAWPKVSVLWLNYNSSRILDLVLRSLEAVSELDYPSDRYELVVVDNGSTDGSFEKIREFLERRGGLRKKVIRLDRNLGFAGGNNVAYKARDRESEYVALLNNDAVPTKDSLRVLVECARQHENVGAAQGVILDVDTGAIDTAGDMLCELLIGGQLYQGKPPQVVKRPFYVTYADGAYFLLKVEAAKRATGSPDKLFYDEAFGYLDDSLLGLQLWDAGYRVVSYPVVSAYHRRSSTFGRVTPLKLYLITRGYYALNELCNSRYKEFIRSSTYLRLIRGAVASVAAKNLLSGYRGMPPAREFVYSVMKGYAQGVKLGRAKLKERGRPVDIYKAALLPTTLSELQAVITGLGLDYYKRKLAELVTRKFEQNISRYLVE